MLSPTVDDADTRIALVLRASQEGGELELGRLNMENADLKSQLKERDARIAKLESVLEESRRAGKRQAAPFFSRTLRVESVQV